MSLTDKQQAFIKEFGTVDPGMPRAMSSILGYMLVCEPLEQSSQDLQQKLNLSAGSVSTMLSMLVDSGLVSKVKHPGDRKYYYIMTEDSWRRTLEIRLESTNRVRALMAKGVVDSPDNYRMKEIFQVYDLLAMNLEKMIRHLNARN